LDEPERAPVHGRMVSIDILRGVAILWVVLFHLWGDLEFFPGVPREYYQQLTWQVKHGSGPWAVFTSFTDLFFRDGFQGVPLFMMISGVSLTIAAYRAGDGLRWPRFFFARFRKLLLPYWVGVAITYAVISAIAWRQASIGDGSFSGHFGHGLTISLHTIILIDSGVVWASIALVPRLFEDQWFFAPQLALWFVGLLAQYYLLFPLLFLVMRKIGVVAFLALTFGVTVLANWWLVHEYGALELKFFLVTGWAPFRLFEFTAGMAIGWLLIAPDGRRWLARLRNPYVLGSALAIGLAAHTVGDLWIGRWTATELTAGGPGIYLQSLALPLVTLGLALMALPLLVKPPSRVDVSVPVRALTTIGVMSYALLIVNDPMRLVASQLRLEDVSSAVWWTFLVAVYVPASVALAWPLARVLSLMPKGPAASTERPPRLEPPPSVAAPAPEAVEAAS
jgi:peptidoglycan/LPS O-acetylase OafA/YrhL